MANVKKANRVQDTDIKRLNHVGLGLKAIADLLGCHAATVTLRLKAMNLSPIDTRRSFMESVFLELTPEEQDWLSHNLFNNGISIKTFVTQLIKEAYGVAPAVATAAPVAMPPMLSGIDPAMVQEAQEVVQEVQSEPDSAAQMQQAATLTVPPEKIEEAEPVKPTNLPTQPQSLFK